MKYQTSGKGGVEHSSNSGDVESPSTSQRPTELDSGRCTYSTSSVGIKGSGTKGAVSPKKLLSAAKNEVRGDGSRSQSKTPSKGEPPPTHSSVTIGDCPDVQNPLNASASSKSNSTHHNHGGSEDDATYDDDTDGYDEHGDSRRERGDSSDFTLNQSLSSSMDHSLLSCSHGVRAYSVDVDCRSDAGDFHIGEEESRFERLQFFSKDSFTSSVGPGLMGFIGGSTPPPSDTFNDK
jgi:hypothetical protein